MLIYLVPQFLISANITQKYTGIKYLFKYVKAIFPRHKLFNTAELVIMSFRTFV
jgi:hypothetical protein